VPTAAWGGQGSAQRPTRIIGAKGLDDDFSVNRPQTVAERHGYGGRQQQRSATPPPPPAAPVRSAPKPAQGQPVRKPVTAGNGNGGNGNGHSGSYSYHSLDEE
jgi:hypothetical protein